MTLYVSVSGCMNVCVPVNANVLMCANACDSVCVWMYCCDCVVVVACVCVCVCVCVCLCE